jgi:hypothetical protein
MNIKEMSALELVLAAAVDVAGGLHLPRLPAFSNSHFGHA